MINLNPREKAIILRLLNKDLSQLRKEINMFPKSESVNKVMITNYEELVKKLVSTIS